MSPDLVRRIAEALKWSERDVTSFSTRALRDLLAPVSPKLALELTQDIQSGRVIVGDRR